MPGLKELKMVRGVMQGLTGTGKAAQNMLKIQEARNQIERQKEVDKLNKKQKDSTIALNEMKLESLEYKMKKQEQDDLMVTERYKNYMKGFNSGGGGANASDVDSNAPFLNDGPISKASFQQAFENPAAFEKEERARRDQTIQETKFRQGQEDRELKSTKEQEKEIDVQIATKAKDIMDFVFKSDLAKGLRPTPEKILNHPLLGKAAFEYFGISFSPKDRSMTSKKTISPYTLKQFLNKQQERQALLGQATTSELERFNSYSYKEQESILAILKRENK